MKLFDFFKRKAIEKEMSSLLTVLGGSSASAQKQGSTQLLKAYKESPWLRAVTGKIAHSVASVPWKVFVLQNKDGKAIRSKAASVGTRKIRNQMLREEISKGATLVELESHPLLDVLAHGNELLNGLVAMKTAVLQYDLVGEAFLRKERGRPLNTVKHLWPVPPHWVKELPTVDRPFFILEVNGKREMVEKQDMIWIMDPDPADPYQRGVGIGHSLGDEIDTDEHSSKFIKDFFYNGARPDIVVYADGLNKEDTRRLELAWNRKHQGFFKNFKTHFANTKLEIEKLGQDLSSLKIIDLRKFQRDLIMQVYGVPPEILGVIESSNRATIEGAETIYARWVLEPRLETFRTFKQQQLVPDFDSRLILDYESPVPDDTDLKFNAMKASPQSFTDNEWRELAGFEELESEENHRWVGFNQVIVEDSQIEGNMAQTEFEGLEEDKSAQNVCKSQYINKILLTQSEISQIVGATKAKHFIDQLESEVKNLIETFGEEALGMLGTSGFQNTETIRDFIANQAFDGFHNKVNVTTQKELRSILEESVLAEDSIVTLTSKIDSVFDKANSFRARMIARTETVKLANFSTLEGFKQGHISKKRWLATRDSATRDSHNSLEGQERSLNANFNSPTTGAEGPHPGKMNAASENINCRCTVIPVIDERWFSSEQKDAIWKNFESTRSPFEKVFVKKVRKAFDLQRADVLATLNKVIGE